MREPITDVCNPNEFEKAFHKYSEELFKALYYKYGLEEQARDTVHDAFEKLWVNCAKVLPEKVWGFIYTVANNTILNLIKRNTQFPEAEIKTSYRTYDQESPQYQLEEKEYMETLNRAINELSEAQREAFLLNRIEKKSHKEIAQLLGISRKAVEKRIYTALSNLREKVEGL